MEIKNRTFKRAIRARQLWLCVGWMLVFSVIYLSLARLAIQTHIGQGDKLSHAMAYGTLMVWFSSLYQARGERPMLAVSLVAMGVGLEFVQRWTGYRTFEVADMVANAVGVSAGWFAAPPRLPNFLVELEALFTP